MNAQMSDDYRDSLFIKEKINGKIYLLARPTDKYMDIQGNIAYIFSDYFRKNKKKCVTRVEAQLDIDNDNYLVPDVMVFCYNTNRNIPLIVIEVLSKSTRARDLGIKMEKYAEIGVKEYWIVDYKNYSIDIYLLMENKAYDRYTSYSYYTNEDFSRYPKIREEQMAEIEIIEEFSPATMPEMTVKLEDVFYFIDEQGEDFNE